MSILLLGFSKALTAPLIHRLLAEGDQVRIIEPNPHHALTWRESGAYVAEGEPDEDLVERAGQGVRSIVIGDVARNVDAALNGADRAGIRRAIIYSRFAIRVALPEWVIILPLRRRFFRRMSELAPYSIASVIDAADDLAGNPQLELDLSSRSAWKILGLCPPNEGEIRHK